MNGKRNILYKQSWKTWLEVLINYIKGPFMDVVDFIIKISTMAHLDYRTIIKLWSDKRLLENAAFLTILWGWRLKG